MTKEVLVSVQGLQFADEAETDEELDTIETICPGEYYYKNEAHFVIYDEISDDFEQPVKNMMKLRGREFSLTKKGLVNMQMVFSEGKKTMTNYMTPFGNILISIDTKEVNVEESDNNIIIHISYGLEANYQFISDCDITVEIKNRTS